MSIAAFARLIYTEGIEDLPEKYRAVLTDTQGLERTTDVFKAVFSVGNFFEQLAIAVKANEVNEGLLYDFYCGMFYRSYMYMRDFMPVLRNDDRFPDHSHGQAQLPELFATVQWLFDRWKPCYEAQFKVDPALFDAANASSA